MHLKLSVLTLALVGLTASPVANAGPIAYGICQTGCNTVTVACYAAAGFTFGTVTTGIGVPAAILACNAALRTCSSTCATVALFAPTP